MSDKHAIHNSFTFPNNSFRQVQSVVTIFFHEEAAVPRS